MLTIRNTSSAHRLCWMRIGEHLLLIWYPVHDLGGTCCSYATLCTILSDTCPSHATLDMIWETPAAHMPHWIGFGRHLLLICNTGYGLGDTCCSYATLDMIWGTHAAHMQHWIWFGRHLLLICNIRYDLGDTCFSYATLDMNWETPAAHMQH